MQFTSSAETALSAPKRTVPAWCAVAPIGMPYAPTDEAVLEQVHAVHVHGEAARLNPTALPVRPATGPGPLPPESDARRGFACMGRSPGRQSSNGLGATHSPQTMRASIAVISRAHQGVQGSHMKLVIMLRPASATPTIRAQVAPLNRAAPVTAIRRPKMRWIQPQPVRSNSKT